eukprot:10502877-Ditylum_brightwellii.AAC.1
MFPSPCRLTGEKEKAALFCVIEIYSNGGIANGACKRHCKRSCGAGAWFHDSKPVFGGWEGSHNMCMFWQA